MVGSGEGGSPSLPSEVGLIATQFGSGESCPLRVGPRQGCPLLPCMAWVPPSGALLVIRGGWSRGIHAAQCDPEAEKAAGLHLLQGCCWSSLDIHPTPYPMPWRYEMMVLRQLPGGKKCSLGGIEGGRRTEGEKQVRHGRNAHAAPQRQCQPGNGVEGRERCRHHPHRLATQCHCTSHSVQRPVYLMCLKKLSETSI